MKTTANGADPLTLSVVERLSRKLSWTDQEGDIVQLETGQFQRFDVRRFGNLVLVIESSVDNWMTTDERAEAVAELLARLRARGAVSLSRSTKPTCRCANSARS
jgi:hypothetical protein